MLLIALAQVLSAATGTAVNAVAVAPGGTIVGTAAAPADLIVLSRVASSTATQWQTALAGGGYNITHSAAVAATNYDFLLAYQGQDGNAHLADLHILGAGGASTHTGTGAGQDANVNVSDIATLVGVNLTAARHQCQPRPYRDLTRTD